MALREKINGANSFEIAKDCVQRIKFRTNIPLDSDVGVKNVGSTLEIRKKFLAADSTSRLALCLVVPLEEAVRVQEGRGFRGTVFHVHLWLITRKIF